MAASPRSRKLTAFTATSPAAGRGNSTFPAARVRASRRGRAREPRSRARPSGGTLSTPGAGELRARGGADRPQERMPVFARADGSLSEPRAGAARPRSAGHGAQRVCVQAARGDSARLSGDSACATGGCRVERDGEPLRFQPVGAAGSRRRRATGCWSVSSTKPGRSAAKAAPSGPAEVSARRRTRTGAGRDADRTAGRHPQPGDFGRGAEGDQRGGAVGQRGIPVDQRGAADLEGGTAVAQRGTDRAEQPAAGNAGAPAHHLQRSAERAVQHRCRDAVPRRRPEHPLLHAGHAVAVQRHSRRYRAAAGRPQLAGRRRRAAGRRARRCCETLRRSSARSRRGAAPGTCAASCPTAPRTTACEGVVITFADITERKRRRRGAGGGQAAGRSGQRGEIALSRRRQPRSAPAAADAGACCRGCWRRRSRASGRRSWSARLDETLGAMSGMLEHAARHQPDRGRRGRTPRWPTFPIDDLLDRLRDEFTYHAQAQGSPCAWCRAACRSAAIRACSSR